MAWPGLCERNRFPHNEGGRVEGKGWRMGDVVPRAAADVGRPMTSPVAPAGQSVDAAAWNGAYLRFEDLGAVLPGQPSPLVAQLARELSGVRRSADGRHFRRRLGWRRARPSRCRGDGSAARPTRRWPVRTDRGLVDHPRSGPSRPGCGAPHRRRPGGSAATGELPRGAGAGARRE